MEEENKPSETDGLERELDSNLGDENVSSDDTIDTGEFSGEESQEDTLAKLNEITGKQFNSIEDFQKHYHNLVSFSGTEEAQTLRKKAKLYDEIQKEAGSVVNELDKDQKAEVLGGVKSDEVRSEIEELKHNFEKSEFLRGYPDAKEHLALVEAVADHKGISLKEAWETEVKDLAIAKSAKEKEHSDITESKPRVAPLKAKKLSQIVKEINDTDSEEAKQKLVEEMLGDSL